jgi:outer membrane protein assembly factor BamE
LEENVSQVVPLIRPLALGCLLAGLVGCGSNFGFPGVYRINVEQGNVVTEEMLEQLRPGLNRRQVRYVMGTPLIEDSFHEDRWDYRYLLRNGSELLSETHLTLWFEEDELVRVEGPDAPNWDGPQSEASVAEAPEAS